MPLNQWGSVNQWAFGSTVRAVILVAGNKQQITDVQIGTGQKPLVLFDGSLRIRATVEGVPVVYENGYLRTIAAGETLLI